MKSLIVLVAIATFTVGSAVAGKPSFFVSETSVARNASQPVLIAARQELPFDRYPSRN